IERAGALARFGGVFMGTLWDLRPREVLAVMSASSGAARLTERVVPFRAGDGFSCNLVNVRGEGAPTKGAVILVHGAGVRANLFRAPVRTTIVDYLHVLPEYGTSTCSGAPGRCVTHSRSFWRSSTNGTEATPRRHSP